MLIDRFLEKGREFLGCKYPIICGAMTWVSDPKLVSSIANAGGFGLLAGGNTPVDVFEKQIIETGFEISENSSPNKDHGVRFTIAKKPAANAE